MGWTYKGNFTDSPEELRSKIKVGMWATACCDLDRFQIKNETEINEILSDDEIGYMIFDTEKELVEILKTAREEGERQWHTEDP